MTTLVVFAVSVIGRTIYEIRKREVIENELKIASQIQQSFLPPSLPQQKGLSLALYMKPAKAVGGDLYTFIPLKDDKIGVMVGDVSGKGTPAALFMAKVVSEFKFSARDRTDPSQVLTALNDSIASESTGGLFVTLSYVIFDVHSRKLILSNGGHLPLVVAGSSGSELVSAEGGMPVGVMEGASFSNLERPVRPGDCFAFYTDGVSEARNRKKEEYGIETLQKMITENRHLSAQGILDRTVRSLNQFMGKADQHDDITLIVVKIEESLS
jgi:sigma-B regulation protein RsbU (phosphoserine phosphatase)